MQVFIRYIFSVLIVSVVASCATTEPGAIKTIAEEKELGIKVTPGFLLSKGGIYNDPEIQQYVESLVAKLSQTLDIPEELNPIPIGILDTNTPSAYAVAGGSIYVSRGIIAMSDNEAQLAGVIAHEIGHVIARHTAKSVAATERLILDVVAKNRTTLLQAESKDERLAIIGRKFASRRSEVSAFSKEQELEADQLAIEILAASGYDPHGFGDLLRRLDAWQLNRAKKTGVTPEELTAITERSGYPEIDARVQALGALKPVPAAAGSRERLLSAIDGMRFEDVFDGGFIRDEVYWNKKHRLSFDVPSGFSPRHGETFSMASAHGEVTLRFQRLQPGRFRHLIQFIKDTGLSFENPEMTTINGIPAVSGIAGYIDEDQSVAGRVVFFNLDTHVAIMTFLSEAWEKPFVKSLFENIVSSVRRTRAEEIPLLRIYDVQKVKPGQNLNALAAGAAFDGDPVISARLLNGLGDDEKIEAGDWIKLIK